MRKVIDAAVAKAYGDKVSEEEKSEIESDLAALKEAIEGDDTEVIQAKFEALGNSSMKLGEAIYKAEQAATEAPADDGSGPAASEDDTVFDADFEEVEDEDDTKDQSSAS